MENIQGVGILDLIFYVILAISILVGLIRGVIREVLSIAGLVVALYLAFTFSDAVSKKYVLQFLENEPRISYILTFTLIIVATLFAVTLINLFFSQLLKASGLSFVNRFFGIVFGALRGGIICAIIVLVLGFIPGVPDKSWWQASTLVPTLKNLTRSAFKYLPKEVGGYVDSARDSVGRITSDIVLPSTSSPNSTTQSQENLHQNRSASSQRVNRPQSVQNPVQPTQPEKLVLESLEN